MKCSIHAANRVVGFANINTQVLRQFRSNWLGFKKCSELEFAQSRVQLIPVLSVVNSQPTSATVLAKPQSKLVRTIPTRAGMKWEGGYVAGFVVKPEGICVLVASSANQTMQLGNGVKLSRARKVPATQHYRDWEVPTLPEMCRVIDLFGLKAYRFQPYYNEPSVERARLIPTVSPFYSNTRTLAYCWPNVRLRQSRLSERDSTLSASYLTSTRTAGAYEKDPVYWYVDGYTGKRDYVISYDTSTQVLVRPVRYSVVIPRSEFPKRSLSCY